MYKTITGDPIEIRQNARDANPHTKLDLCRGKLAHLAGTCQDSPGKIRRTAATHQYSHGQKRELPTRRGA